MYRPILDRYASGPSESMTDTATLNHDIQFPTITKELDKGHHHAEF